jgi:hypothetical protein
VTSDLSFGAQYAALDTVEERLALETAAAGRGPFAEIDAIMDRLVLRALHGERVVEPLSAPRGEVRLVLTGEDDQHLLTEHFELERQQARGAWYKPKGNGLQVGLVHVACWQKTKPRYLLTLATEEVAVADFHRVDAVVVWAVLEPIFDALSLPLRLRAGRWAGEKTVEQQQGYWTKTIWPVYDALGLSGEAVRAFAPNTGWAELDREQVEGRRAALLAPWSDATIETAKRLRTLRIGQLVERYYAKAKGAAALRSRVMNDRGAERTLTAYFGGDWLALLEYLGEEPHPDEQVTRALPQTRLMVGTSERAASVAAEHGLPTEEVERMVAAYWRQTDGTSPPEQRVRVLKHLWQGFDDAHARQAPGMKSLSSIWGDGHNSDPDTTNGVHGDMDLREELLRDVERLWGTKLNPRSPERLVTESFPQSAASHTFGPALYFWYRAGLNAWNICEGGSAHSELEDFEQYMARETEAVANVGFPVDADLFTELRAAESKLGPVEEIYETTSEEHIGPVTLSMQIGGRTRRDGFEILRDIITRHRRLWADQHLDDYLQACWRRELEAVGVAYNRHAADRAKPPTVRQFANIAKDAASHWFAGDLTGVYGALGLTSPMPAPSYERLLPTDIRAFQGRVRTLLEARLRSQRVQLQEREETLLKVATNQLAHYAIDWVELRESIGQPPELKQFGVPRFRNASSSQLWDDLDEGWQTFSSVVQTALAEFAAGTPGPVATAARDTRSERLSTARTSPELAVLPHPPRSQPVAVQTSEQAEPDGDGQARTRRGRLRRLLRG